MKPSVTILVCLLACLRLPQAVVLQLKAAAADRQPAVEVEEEVYAHKASNNGSGPMWCSGSTCLVRSGESVFASGVETLADVPPLNNVRWTFWKRDAAGWQLVRADPAGRTREPCPLAVFGDSRVLLSANPTLTGRDKRNGPARPEVLEFKASDPRGPFKTLVPKWAGTPRFFEHSYRSFAADGPARELILIQNAAHTHTEWSLLAANGQWAAQGRLVWPWGAEYDQPQPIRLCYPAVMLRDLAVHFCGVSDIVEPYQKWRQYKKKLTGRDWDYDFRRLFYTWSDDVTTGKFHDWIEVASHDKTAGWVMPCDLWVDREGIVHLLWADRAIDTRLCKEFFPDAKQSYGLWYGRVERGKLLRPRAIVVAEEGRSREIPQWGRFHATPDGRLFVIGYVDGRTAEGKPTAENRLWELGPGGNIGPAFALPMRQPLVRYFTATVRGGSAPSTTLDLLGTNTASPTVIRYARIRLW